MLTSNWFWWFNSSMQLVMWYSCVVWMWRTILFTMLCIVSWSQGLVMVKDPCEVTITKRLAWLVELLVVSSHEFSFTLFWKLFPLFSHFSIDIFTILLVHFVSSSFLFCFPNHFSFVFFAVFIAFSTYHMLDFLFLSFTFFPNFLTKKNC